MLLVSVGRKYLAAIQQSWIDWNLLQDKVET